MSIKDRFMSPRNLFGTVNTEAKMMDDDSSIESISDKEDDQDI